jgi:hypothetical protein
MTPRIESEAGRPIMEDGDYAAATYAQNAEYYARAKSEAVRDAAEAIAAKVADRTARKLRNGEPDRARDRYAIIYQAARAGAFEAAQAQAELVEALRRVAPLLANGGFVQVAEQIEELLARIEGMDA